MVEAKTEIKVHPTEIELADYLDGALSGIDRERIENHAASCNDCLTKIVSAHESVSQLRGKNAKGTRRDNLMKKINIYLILAILFFLFSFAVPRYFIQFLVATLLLGIKWIADAKSTRMLVMIYEAWKKGGEKEASRIIETLDSPPKNRL